MHTADEITHDRTRQRLGTICQPSQSRISIHCCISVTESILSHSNGGTVGSHPVTAHPLPRPHPYPPLSYSTCLKLLFTCAMIFIYCTRPSSGPLEAPTGSYSNPDQSRGPAASLLSWRTLADGIYITGTGNRLLRDGAHSTDGGAVCM